MIYSLAIYLYMWGAILAAPFYKKARQMVVGHWRTFHLLRKQIDRTQKYVWFHAASLGEFEQGRPLMERFRAQYPEYKILLTFFSPSGYEVRKGYAGADIICYLPFDTPGNVLSFFRLVRPEMAFFIKYEFWLNFLYACHHYHIPVYSVSSIFRPDKVFFHWYGRSYAQVLHYVEHFFVQDEESKALLATHGIVDNVTVAGDTRFDRVLDICRQAKPLPLIDAFGTQASKVMVAGSSWDSDEDLIIPYFNAHPEMKLVLAPHVIDEGHLRRIESKLQRPHLRYTDATSESIEKADCLIINCFGLLSSMYRYGQIAYVGGGFGAGIHNVPEAAVYGVPVLIGPNNQGFREAQALLRLGGCVQVKDTASFVACMDRFLTDEEERLRAGRIAGDYIASNAGAADRVFACVMK